MTVCHCKMAFHKRGLIISKIGLKRGPPNGPKTGPTYDPKWPPTRDPKWPQGGPKIVPRGLKRGQVKSPNEKQYVSKNTDVSLFFPLKMT